CTFPLRQTTIRKRPTATIKNTAPTIIITAMAKLTDIATTIVPTPGIGPLIPNNTIARAIPITILVGVIATIVTKI
ncbi:MAG: hypothetical protein KDF65_14800, partial [Anaerolineae bacterium]|nr:hypothetical protein [Anaerolineae bacterium]